MKFQNKKIRKKKWYYVKFSHALMTLSFFIKEILTRQLLSRIFFFFFFICQNFYKHSPKKKKIDSFFILFFIQDKNYTLF